ncbi:hypothetical protein HC891_26205 [Candidatus Gracilibacteria bacterium]|nr:hypothetical protein [Candidatus Gracilibacteria bacterium]
MNRLNGLALATIGISFNQLVTEQEGAPAPPKPVVPPATTDRAEEASGSAGSDPRRYSLNWWVAWATIAAVILALLAWLLPDPFGFGDRIDNAPSANVPSSASLESAMWDAYSRQRYGEAVDTATLLINSYLADAQALQQQKLADNVPQPPIGTVSAEERGAIFADGPLNSVAAAYLVRGLAQKELCLRAAGSGDTDAATAARDSARADLQAVSAFPHARSIEPGSNSNAFFAPYGRAIEELGRLSQSTSPLCGGV